MRDQAEGYENLLKPVKDVEKNWEINIADSLRNYLQELVVGLDQDSILNFSKAGLVLQGSAHVFCKKVDHLHNLVLHAFKDLDLPGRKERNKNPAKNPKTTELEFCLVDFEEDSNNDLTTESRSSRKYQDFMPVSLIPKDKFDKGDIVLYSEKKEELGNCMDFRLYSCLRDANGTILLSLPVCHDLPHHNSATHTNVAPDLNYQPHCAEDNLMEDDCAGADAPFDEAEDLPDSPKSAQMTETVAGAGQATFHEAENPVFQHLSDKELSMEKPKFLLVDPHSANKILHPVKSQFKASIPQQMQEKVVLRKSRKRGAMDADHIWDFCDTFYYFEDHELVSSSASKMLNQIYTQEVKSRKKVLLEKTQLLKEQKVNVENLEEEEHLDIGAQPMDDTVNEDELPQDLFWNEPEINGAGGGDPSNFEEMPVASTYEEVARRYLAEYTASACKFQKTTEINQRVNDWRDRINPILDEEAQREAFDVNVYSTRLLGCFEDNNRKQTLPFSKIAEGKDVWEASRYFLTSLLLTNQLNVSLSSEGVLEEGMDTVELTLLSRRRIEEDLNAYCTAPP